MGIGDVAVYRSTGYNLPTSEDTWEGVVCQTQVKQDSIYVQNANDIDIRIDEQGYYLAIYRVAEWDSPSSNRNILTVRALHNSVEITGSRMANFKRNTSNEDNFVPAGHCIFKVSTTGQNFRVEAMVRGEDSSPGGAADADTEIALVKLADLTPAVAFARYTEGTDNGAYNSGTFTAIPFNTIVEETDTSVIQRITSTTFRLKKIARYLVTYLVTFQNTARAGRISRATLAGTEIPHSNSYLYIRDTDVDYETAGAIFIVDNDTIDQDLSIEFQAGDCSTTGYRSPDTGWESSLFIMELPSSAEVVIGADATGGQETTATGYLNSCRTTPVIDAASFTRIDNTTIEIEKAADYLFMVGARIIRAVSSGTRSQHGLRWTKNNIDQQAISLKYMRGLQSSTFTRQASFNGSFIADLAINDQIEFEFFQAASGGLGQTVGGSVGMSAINLDTLFGVTVGTKEFTADALLMETSEKDFTSDAVLVDRLTKTFDGDAVLVDRLGKTFDADAVLVDRLDKTFNVDAVLVDRLGKTFGVDAVLVDRLTKTVDVDAVLVNRLSKDFTADALLKETLTKDFTADALLQQTLEKTFTADALLQLRGFKEFTADGMLLKTQEKTFTVDALLQETFEKTLTADGVLVDRLTKTFDVDAVLKLITEKTFGADAVLVDRLTKDFTADAVLQLRGFEEFTTDAVLKLITTKEFTADALLLETLKKEFTADAVLQRRGFKSFTADAVLKLVGTKGFTADALLQQTLEKNFTADAVLQLRGFKEFTVDAFLKVTTEKTFQADAILVDRFEKTFQTDAVLVDRQIKTFTADAVLTSAVSVETKDFTADAVLKLITGKTVSADAVLVDRLTKDFTADAFLKVTKTREFTADALLRETYEKAFDADAVLVDRLTKTITADAVLQLIGTRTFTADAVLKRIQQINIEVFDLLERGIEISPVQERTIAISPPQERGIEISDVLERGIEISDVRERGIEIGEIVMVYLGDTFQIPYKTTDFDGSDLTPDSQSIKLYDPDGTEVDEDTAPTGTPPNYTAKLKAPLTSDHGTFKIVIKITKNAEDKYEEESLYVEPAP